MSRDDCRISKARWTALSLTTWETTRSSCQQCFKQRRPRPIPSQRQVGCAEERRSQCGSRQGTEPGPAATVSDTGRSVLRNASRCAEVSERSRSSLSAARSTSASVKPRSSRKGTPEYAGRQSVPGVARLLRRPNFTARFSSLSWFWETLLPLSLLLLNVTRTHGFSLPMRSSQVVDLLAK